MTFGNGHPADETRKGEKALWLPPAERDVATGRGLRRDPGFGPIRRVGRQRHGATHAAPRPSVQDWLGFPAWQVCVRLPDV